MAEKEDNEFGFAGISKRIEKLKEDVNLEDTVDWKQETETTSQTKEDSAKEQESPKIYKQKAGIPFRLSINKVFWGIVAIIIIASIFSQSNEKKKTDYSSSPESVRVPAPEVVPMPSIEFQRTSPGNNKKLSSTTPGPVQEFDQLPNDNDMVTDGQYRCSQYHHNKAQELEPTISEKQNLEQQQTIVNQESQEIDMLKEQIDTMHVNRYSQESIDAYNMLVNNYNTKLENFRLNASNLEQEIDNYNAKVASHNNYLMSNCRKTH